MRMPTHHKQSMKWLQSDLCIQYALPAKPILAKGRILEQDRHTACISGYRQFVSHLMLSLTDYANRWSCSQVAGTIQTTCSLTCTWHCMSTYDTAEIVTTYKLASYQGSWEGGKYFPPTQRPWARGYIQTYVHTYTYNYTWWAKYIVMLACYDQGQAAF